MTKDDWRRAIEEQKRSGKTIGAYCRERGLNRKTFSVSKSKLKSSFVQVSGRRPVEIVLESGVIIRADISDVPAVLRALDA